MEIVKLLITSPMATVKINKLWSHIKNSLKLKITYGIFVQ